MFASLTLKQLRYIDAAGRNNSISAAATELNISESSIAGAIDALEQELGFDLFSRVPAKGIQPTPAGQDCLRLIFEFLSRFSDFQNELTDVGGTSTGTVRLACFANAASAFLPPVIKKFQVSHPAVRFELIEGSMDTVIDHLNQGKADIAMTYEEVIGKKHTFNALVSLPHYALLPINDSLTQQKSIRLSDLSDRNMVNLELHKTKSYYTDLFKNAGLDINVIHSSGSVEMVRTLIASNFGFTILNAMPSHFMHEDGGCKAVPISDFLAPREFGIVRQSGIRNSRAVRRFVDHCLAMRTAGIFEKMALRAN